MMKHPLFSSRKSQGAFWFRILGWGLRGMDLRHHDMLFSERMGIGVYFYFRWWSFKILIPNQPGR